MKKLFTIIGALMIALTLVNFQCNIVDPPPGNPPGYQFDIPWPSLADSPWPMNHHDPQSTGRSKYIGPQNGIVQWQFEGDYNQAGISLGNDSTIYFAETGGIYSLDLLGNVIWNYKIDAQIIMTPLIANDGTIYFASFSTNDSLIALNGNGSVRWRIDLGKAIGPNMLNIDLNGNIYVVASTSLFCVSKNGEILWELVDQRINSAGNGISFSPDGKVLYIPGISVSVLAININQQVINWTFGNETLSSPPTIDNDGNLYFIPLSNTNTDSTAKLYCITSNGSLKWKYEFTYPPLTGLNLKSPAIDREGNIYFATDTLYSISYEGNLNWSKMLKSICDSPVICDINSNIYVATQGGLEKKVYLYGFDSLGNELWNLEFMARQVGPCPAITKEGGLIYTSWRGFNLFYVF